MFKYLFICLLIFGIGDFLGTLTKAKLSSVFVSLMLFLVLFITNVIPADIIEQAGLTEIGQWASPFIIFHMGTMINLKELVSEWRTVVISVISMIVAIIMMIVIIPIIGKESAFISIPILNGGIIATQIMTEGAMEKGFAASAALGAIVYAVQKFFGTPFASHFGLKEAEKVLKTYRETGVNPFKTTKKTTENEQVKFADKHIKYYGNFVCFAITAFFAYLSKILGSISPISYSIWALLLGVLACYIGIAPKNILDRSKASGLLNMAVFASIIPSLGKIEANQLLSLGFKTIVIFGVLMIGIYIFIGILPTWKILGSKNISLGVAVAQLLGFPATYLISNEIASAVAQNEDEKAMILDMLMPKYVVAGLATVTSISIIIAGIFVKLL
ncbi:MAG: hypothetical protein Q4P25_03015 [Tissierellia bacterium]|nr:hypothetical protein [Tissierellia bacterium]